MMRPTARK